MAEVVFLPAEKGHTERSMPLNYITHPVKDSLNLNPKLTLKPSQPRIPEVALAVLTGKNTLSSLALIC